MKLFLVLMLSVVSTFAELPDFKKLPDYRHDYHCDAFSLQALLALHAKSIPATQIFYRWDAPGFVGHHAAVLFQYEGSFYFMDNTRTTPRKVTAKTDHGCIVQVTPKNCFVTLVNRRGDEVKPRTMAERFSK